MNKQELITELKSLPDYLAHDFADEQGYNLVDITCEAQVRSGKCGNVIRHYIVDKRSSITDDTQYMICPACGTKGQWSWAPSPEVAAPPKVEEPAQPVVTPPVEVKPVEPVSAQ